MRSWHFAGLIVLAVAIRAHAIAIGLEWADNPANPISARVPPNAPVKARFYLANGSANAAEHPRIREIALRINAWENAACTIPANMRVLQVSASALLPGWRVAPVSNNSALNGPQLAAIAGPVTRIPQGKTYAMDITFQWASDRPMPYYYLTISRDGLSVIDGNGGNYLKKDTLWSPSGFSNAGKAKWGFGNWGGSKWLKYDSATGDYLGQTVNPLLLHTEPKPNAMMLAWAGVMGVGTRRPVLGGG